MLGMILAERARRDGRHRVTSTAAIALAVEQPRPVFVLGCLHVVLGNLTRAVQVCGLVSGEHYDLGASERDWMELTRERFDDAVRVEAERTRSRLFPAATV